MKPLTKSLLLLGALNGLLLSVMLVVGYFFFPVDVPRPRLLHDGHGELSLRDSDVQLLIYVAFVFISAVAGTVLARRAWSSATGPRKGALSTVPRTAHAGLLVTAYSGLPLGVINSALGALAVVLLYLPEITEHQDIFTAASVAITFLIAFLVCLLVLLPLTISAAVILGVLSGAVFLIGWLFVRFEQRHLQTLARGGAGPGT